MVDLQAPSLAKPRFSPVAAALWLVVSSLIGPVVSALAFRISFFSAPLAIFPLAVGAGQGVALAIALRLIQLGHRPTILLGAVVSVLLAIVGQHYVSYRYDRRHAEDVRPQLNGELAKKLPGMSPELFTDRLAPISTSFGDYLQRQAENGRPISTKITLRGAAVWASWAGDALLQLIAMLAVIAWCVRQPYCGRCGSWYRTIRKGKVANTIGNDLAQVAGVELPADATSTDFTLLCCIGGCGPTRLDLVPSGGRDPGRTASAWLSESARGQVQQILDAQRTN